MVPEPFLSWFQALYLLLRENEVKALFLVLLVEESGVPLPFVPGDVIIMFAGYRASLGEMGLLEALVAVTLAVQLGSTILYLLSRRFGHAFVFKYGKFIHLDEVRLKQIERWIQRRGPVMVLVGRLTPGLRTPTSVMSGIFEIPFPTFLFYTTLSAILWCVFWLLLGYYSGRSLLPLVRQYHGQLSVATVVVLGVLAAIGLVVLRWRRRKGRSGGSKEAKVGQAAVSSGGATGSALSQEL